MRQTFVPAVSKNLGMQVIQKLKFLGKIVFRKRANAPKDPLMAKVIEFYIPAKFSMPTPARAPQKMGRLIAFRPSEKKSA